MSALEHESQAFAKRISDAVSAFVGKTVPFKATSRGARFVVSDDTDGIVIPVGDGGTLALEVNYRCELDQSGHYLKVLSSKVAVYAGSRPKGDPLFRFEYVHDQGHGLPAGHLHVHAHRDQFTRVMTLAAMSGAARRQVAPEAELEAARMSRIHFPTGGHRFRPTLEDVLQMIEEEFGAKPGPTIEPADRVGAAELVDRVAGCRVEALEERVPDRAQHRWAAVSVHEARQQRSRGLRFLGDGDTEDPTFGKPITSRRTAWSPSASQTWFGYSCQPLMPSSALAGHGHEHRRVGRCGSPDRRRCRCSRTFQPTRRTLR